MLTFRLSSVSSDLIGEFSGFYYQRYFITKTTFVKYQFAYNKNHNNSRINFFIYSCICWTERSVFCNLSVKWKNKRKTEIWKFHTVIKEGGKSMSKICVFYFLKNHILRDTKCESLKGRNDPKRQHNENEKVTGNFFRFNGLAIAI